MADQLLDLETVGGDDVGLRQSAVAHDVDNAGADVDRRVIVADDGIAAIDRARVCLFYLAHRVENRLADAGVAHVAG